MFAGATAATSLAAAVLAALPLLRRAEAAAAACETAATAMEKAAVEFEAASKIMNRDLPAALDGAAAAAAEWDAFGKSANRVAFQLGLAPDEKGRGAGGGGGSPQQLQLRGAAAAAEGAVVAAAEGAASAAASAATAAAEVAAPFTGVPLDLAARLAQDVLSVTRALLPSFQTLEGRWKASGFGGDPRTTAAAARRALPPAASAAAADARAWIARWRTAQGRPVQSGAGAARVLDALLAAERAASAAASASGELDAALRGATAALASMDSMDSSGDEDEVGKGADGVGK